MRTLWKRLRLTYLLFAATAVLLVGLAGFSLRYPGSSAALLNEFRYATTEESCNLSECLSYWLETMGQIEFDPATGRYGFDTVDATRLDTFGQGKLAYHRGDFAGAIRLIREAIDQQGANEARLFWLGMAHLRQSEAENCLARLNCPDGPAGRPDTHCCGQASVCSLPLHNFHDRATHAREAARIFESLLDLHDGENRLYRWLLNFMAMTTNDFPERVPERYRIGGRFVETFFGREGLSTASPHASLTFRECAREFGVDTWNAGRGVAVEDFDGDGLLDLIVAGNFDGLRYFKNDRGMRFLDQTAASGLGNVPQPFIISAADYNNDGHLDLFVGCPFGAYRLFCNRGDGTFDDVTESSGLSAVCPPGHIAATWVSAWADVNNDGRLDLFLAQWGMRLPFVQGVLARPRMDCKLFLNAGGGRFVDRTREFGLDAVVRDGFFIGAAFGDYDNDGYPDLFLSSPLRNTSCLLRNIAGRRLEKTNLVRRPEGGFVAGFLDLNHDGRLDIFQSGFADARTSTKLTVFGEGEGRMHFGHHTVFLQTPAGGFQERSDLFDMPMGTMGASYGDVNNDGLHDFYLGKGTPESWFLLPNLFYVSEADGTRFGGWLTNLSMRSGLGTLQKGHGIVFADFNEDGRQDIFSCLGGMWPGDRWRNQLFLNTGLDTNRWVKLRLRGRQTNHFGVGARIGVRARRADGEEVRRCYHMDNKTGFGSAPYLAHIGLMDAVALEEVAVYWPVSRTWKRYQVPFCTLATLDEAAGEPMAEGPTDMTAQPIPSTSRAVPVVCLAFLSIFLAGAASINRRWHWPSRVGSFTLGILLGPSVLGWFIPESEQLSSPSRSHDFLVLVCEVGVILLFALAGIQFRSEVGRRSSWGGGGLAGLAVPIALGWMLTVLVDCTLFFSSGVVGLEHTVFLGAILAAAAAPALAYILPSQECGEPSGTVGLPPGSVATLAVCAAALLGLAVLGWGAEAASAGGAFLAGLAVPRGRPASVLRRWLGPLAIRLFLPLFFLVAGLHMRLDLLDTPFLWSVTLLVTSAGWLAIGGSFGLAMCLQPGAEASPAILAAGKERPALLTLLLPAVTLWNAAISPVLFTILALAILGTQLLTAPIVHRVTVVLTRRLAARNTVE